MNCKIVQEHMFEYLSNECSPGLKEGIKDHIGGCVACSRLQDKFQRIEKVIDLEKNITPSPFITTRILQHLENKAVQGSVKLFPTLKPASLAAGILLAMLIGYGIGKLSIYQSPDFESSGNTIESLKADLFIHDFVDENVTGILNE